MAPQPVLTRIRAMFVPRRMLLSLALSAGIAMVVVGFLEAADPPVPQARPVEIVRVFPGENDPIGLLQQPIGYQLADDFTGELRVDDRDIPLDQLVRSDAVATDQSKAAAGLAGLGEVKFTPGPGKEIVRLSPGTHTATALYWKKVGETRESARYYRWTFKAT